MIDDDALLIKPVHVISYLVKISDIFQIKLFLTGAMEST